MEPGMLSVEEFVQEHPEWFEVSAGEYASWLEYASANHLSVNGLWKLYRRRNSYVIEHRGFLGVRQEFQYCGTLDLRGFMEGCEAEWARRKKLYGSRDYLCSSGELRRVELFRKKAQAFYEQADWANAVFCLKLCTSAGDTQSCQMLGRLCFLLGQREGREDPAKAVPWYRTGASCGDVDCCYHLGECLLEGIGAEQDPVTGAGLLGLLADRGHGPAAARLGRLYLEGQFVKIDVAKALAYLRLALENGQDVEEELKRARKLSERSGEDEAEQPGKTEKPELGKSEF